MTDTREDAVEMINSGEVPERQDGSDSSEYDTDLDEQETVEDCNAKSHDRQERSPRDQINNGDSHVTYTEVCDSLGILPFRTILDQLKNTEMQLQHVYMTQNDVKALACALWSNSCIEGLQLKDNGLVGEDLVPVMNVLKTNNTIVNLSLSENVLESVGAMTIDDVLRKTLFLVHLNLSGTRIGDKEMDYIASGVQNNNSLRWMDLSHNAICIDGAKKLGTAIGMNSSLQFLDLGWNHIRMQGAVGLCKGLKKNTSILNLNMSMNGLGFEGSLALDETLQANTCLKFLDISNNRINWEGVTFVARGLKKNRTLQMLKIGNNPINMEGCYELIRAAASPKGQMQHIGLENIPVNGAVLIVADGIKKYRQFTITHGGILDTRDIVGIRKEKPEDPISLVVRYLAMSGLRIIDLFRMSDSYNQGMISKTNFIRGCKRVGVPLSDRDLAVIASRLYHNKQGYISYSALSKGVRGHVREERKEDRRQEVKKRNTLEERRRILKTELPPIHKRSYDDDLSRFYKSSGNFSSVSRTESLTSIHSNSMTNSQILPPIPGTGPTSATPRSVNTFKETNQDGLLQSVSITESEAPEVEAEKGPLEKSINLGTVAPMLGNNGIFKASIVLKYINKYLERRKTEALLLERTSFSTKTEEQK